MFVLFLFMMLIQLVSGAQTQFVLKPENGDCLHPIEIKDSVLGPTTAPSGFGTVMEISGDRNGLYNFEKEHNTVWYWFRAKGDCMLTLDIIPLELKDDYDFILFKAVGKTFCNDVKENNVKPVRSCISRNDVSLKSMTGLSLNAPMEFIHSGPGASYSKALPVKKGEVYYLVVDNVYPNGKGHSIKLHYCNCKAPSETKKVVPAENPQDRPKPVQKADDHSILNISVVDKESQTAVKSNIRIFVKKHTLGPPTITLDSASSGTSTLVSVTTYLIKISAYGYFDYSKEIKTRAIADTIDLKVELDKITVGHNIIFDNILFSGNSDKILPESYPSLENLVSTLKKYPNLAIEIEGHVNCPSSYSDCGKLEDWNQKLSEMRAKAVNDWLTDEGIQQERMTHKGYGASKMLFPDARSEEKMKMNRRVEIKVLSF
jgi:outer membrane protein OmpA-like peptidoglycan-associated protein